MKSKSILICLALLGCQAANALTLQQAKKLYSEGQFDKALPAFQELVKKNPGNATYNQWYGACLYETGRKAEAKKYIETAYNKRVTDAARYMAQYALADMDYEAMDDYVDVFAERLGGNESALSATAAKGYARIRRAADMLGSVEKVQVFDSLTVDKADFLKAYKLSMETGTLNYADVLPESMRSATPEVFVPQSGNRMIWTMPDSTGCMRLAETYKLADGKWDHPSLLPAELNDGGDAAYPFVMADGTTIYYASNGVGSIGGYDIFMSRKDFASGEYLKPQNIGFPYNSPYDDYMYVIDEMTGIGWWATDRNRIADKVTIYMFKRNDVRENYDPDNDDVYSLAALHSIKATWQDDADYTALREAVENIGNDAVKTEEDFSYYVMNGVRYVCLDDFKSSEARSLMEKRIDLAAQLDADRAELHQMRKAYASAKATARTKMSPSILQLENKVASQMDALKRLDNSIRSAEQAAINQ